MNNTRAMRYAMAAAMFVCAAAAAGQRQSKETKKESSERASSNASSGVSSDAGIGVRTVNGQTVVTYKGKEVYSGQTSGAVSARSSSVNGAEYAAAFDGDKVLWESVSGAAEQLKAAPAVDLPGGLTPPGVERQHKKAKASKKKRGDA